MSLESPGRFSKGPPPPVGVSLEGLAFLLPTASSSGPAGSGGGGGASGGGSSLWLGSSGVPSFSRLSGFHLGRAPVVMVIISSGTSYAFILRIFPLACKNRLREYFSSCHKDLSKGPSAPSSASEALLGFIQAGRIPSLESPDSDRAPVSEPEGAASHSFSRFAQGASRRGAPALGPRASAAGRGSSSPALVRRQGGSSDLPASSCRPLSEPAAPSLSLFAPGPRSMMPMPAPMGAPLLLLFSSSLARWTKVSTSFLAAATCLRVPR
mmetsp:Transcript_86668/g.253657  ORF Transcript_86668/g.253657 Transcript_86668/m.253657 type:complete len:267 (-) Transcript_86668:620-1420(-)